MSTNSSAIFLTRDAEQPPAGSVVLLEGPSGTAYQRLHSSGRWSSTTNSREVTWADLQARTDRQGAFPVLLVHNAETCRVALPGPVDPSAASAAQLAEIAELVHRTGAPVQAHAPRTRAGAAALLLTLRAYAKDRG